MPSLKKKRLSRLLLTVSLLGLLRGFLTWEAESDQQRLKVKGGLESLEEIEDTASGSPKDLTSQP